MAWIKRNLSLFISGVLAVALLGVGAWYLWSAIEKNKKADSDILGLKSEIDNMLGRPVTPNQQNVADAKKQLERLNAFMLDAKKYFPPTPPPSEPLNNQSFKSLLQNTIDDLHKQASTVGIRVETNYYFTFDAERLPVMFPQETLRPLSERLSEVQLISSILFKSRINRLIGIRRAMVPGEDRLAQGSPRAAQDYLPGQAQVNAETGMTLWPYELAFIGFSAELAAVQEALQRVNFGLVVKSITSETIREAAPPGQPRDPRDPRRTNAPPQALTTIIDERPLSITMRLEVIKPSHALRTFAMKLGNITGVMQRHWEKALLALALVALIGAVVYLNQLKSTENEKIEQYNRAITKRKPNPVPTVDLTQLSDAVKQATNPPGLNFSPPHNLFNPVKWQRRANGETIKAETGRELGINAVQITKIAPLQLIITLDTQAGSGANMTVVLETNRLAQRSRGYVTTNNTTERRHVSRVFTMREFRIAADGPEADIELADGTKVTVTPASPFRRIEAYKADLYYPPEKTPFLDRRVGDSIVVANENYNIVAITTNEVVVSARSNDRRTTIRTNAVP